MPAIHTRQRWIAIVGVAVALWGGVAPAQTTNAYPMLMSLRPAAARVGEVTTHELSARYNLAGASAVMISGSGVHGEIVPPEGEKPEESARNDVGSSKTGLRITCDADAVPGIRDLRVLTPHGASTVGQIVVAREPIVAENPDNDTPEKARAVDLPAALCGAIEKGEDVDLWRVRLATAATVTFHVTSQRLQNRLHDMQSRVDPLVALRSPAGTTLGTSDNVLAGDPHLMVDLAAGEYLLEVRDVRYAGNADWTYVVEASTRPCPLSVHPLAVAPGSTPALDLFTAAARLGPVPVAIPADAPPGPARVAPVLDGVALAGVGVVVTPLPIVVEPAGGGDLAIPFTSPAALAGQIGAAGEADRWSFTARAGEAFTFEVTARRAGSNLDARLRLLGPDGVVRGEADDATFDRVLSADPLLENWSAPADGQYVLEIGDLHGRGGGGFPYCVRVERSRPGFTLEADTDKTLLAPGMAAPIYVRAVRRGGFSGDIDLAITGLPPGVEAVAGKILGSGGDGCIWLRAAPDAPSGWTSPVISGSATATHADGSHAPISVPAAILQEVYLPGGGRGHFPVESHVVSVAAPMDVRVVRVSTEEIRLEPGGTQRVDVEVERAPDYAGTITLDCMLQHLETPYGNPLPKGVRIVPTASKTLLTAGETSGHLTLEAAADAPPVEGQVVPVTVHVTINFVMKHTFASPPLRISVTTR